MAWAAIWRSPDKQRYNNLPGFRLNDLSYTIQAILQKVPITKIDGYGFLWQGDHSGKALERVPLAQTQWNRERSNDFEQLFKDAPWGIVLHWFGATLDGDDSLAGYLRGFDGLRRIDEYYTRTSAHFLVGGATATDQDEANTSMVGIIQTQVPAPDGTPYVASHLHSLDYKAHELKQQYFVRAFYQLGIENPAIRSVLTDFYDGPRRDPNYRTIAIEMTGADFESPSNRPSLQQIANVLSVVIAVMKRYHITVYNVLGHHEIELRKSDPGKNFISLIRQLIGIKALVDNDVELQALVFSSTGDRSASRSTSSFTNPWELVNNYFKFVRDFFVMVGYPDQVYAWESEVDYWGFLRNLNQKTTASPRENLVNDVEPFNGVQLPLDLDIALKGDSFLEPSHHEGVDLFLANNPNSFNPPVLSTVGLVADGICIYIGYGAVCSNGYMAMFRHHQNDGAEILTIYGHLAELSNLKVGSPYRRGHRLGSIQSSGPLGEGFLHFSIAYGSTWDTVLKNTPVLPASVQPSWIQRRFLSPLEYLRNWNQLQQANKTPR